MHNKGDLSIYRYKPDTVCYVMYVNKNKYYYMDDDGYVESAEFFTNLDSSRMEFVKNFNIENLTRDQIKNIVLNSREIIRHDKINNILDEDR